MMKKVFRRLTAAFCMAVLLLTLAPAAYAADEPAATKNIGKHNYGYYGYGTVPVRSYLFENEQGGLTRVEYDGSGIIVEDYSDSFEYLTSHSVPMELSLWGGFFAGENSNFFVFGQYNDGESDSVEVVRVVKYSKDWQRQSQYSLYGANTKNPFHAGSLACAEAGGKL